MSATATKVASDVTLIDEFADFEVREELERQLEQRLTEVELDSRPALKAFEPNADNDQLGIIRATEPLIRLVAPAGSGKTQTVVNRILKLASTGTRPDRILCLTFDNSAATALRDKLGEHATALGGVTQDFAITTLNAFGFRLLRDIFPQERKAVLETGRAWRLLSEVKKALASAPGGASRHGALPETLRLRFYLEFFSLLKNETFDPRSLPAQQLADFMLTSPTAEAWFTPGMTTETKRLVIQAVHWMYKSYETRLQREVRLDFDDQKLRALVCLQNAPEALARVQQRYDEIIVDEFQDINKLDFEFIRRIAGQARLIVTGDDDQAIYGFRGCSPSYIIDLAKHLNRTVTTYELRRNYRCPKNIVDHSTRLIRNNTWRLEKNPIAHRPENASIKVVESTTATAEAKALATTIQRIRGKNADLQLKDFAVLYRTNAQSLPIQLPRISRMNH